ncbi:hypothetical protein RA210_U20274 [Rubrivivax sp. A210]|nr:hypothetical protein RA210_U20274 [Rubrivivax sp. A210]
MLILAGAAACAQAAPSDDHARALQAYKAGDVTTAMAVLRPLAKAGHAPSQSLLAFLLENADYLDEAVALYKQAAAADDPEGHAGLANLYLTGRGLAKDEKQALAHFSKAAARGHAASIDVVATAYLKNQMATDAAAEPAVAREAVLRAAGQNHLPSADALAEAYRSGRWGLPVDEAQAAQWQAKAAAWRKQRSPAPVKRK